MLLKTCTDCRLSLPRENFPSRPRNLLANGARTCCFRCSKTRDSKASSDRDFDYLTPFYPGVKCTTYRCENVLFQPGIDALIIPFYQDRAYWSCFECHRLAKMNEPFGPIPDFTEDNGDIYV